MTVETLESAGLTEMDATAIEAFLDSQRVGVLGLPTSGAPYLVPISYGYDGDLYFTFVGGPESRKRTLIDRAETAAFLVYDVRSMFNWESVVLTGPPEPVDGEELAELGETLDGVWRPEVFESALDTDEVAVYRLRVADRSGRKHTGLPPGFGEQ